MEIDSLEGLLAGHSFLKGLDPEQIALIAGCARNVRFEQDEYLFREGDPADTFFVVREGLVALELYPPGKDPVVLQTAGADEIIGWSWMVAPHVWRYSGLAIEPTRALAIDGACLRRKADDNPLLGYLLLTRVAEVMAHRLEATRLQLLDLYGRD
ncbi:MAG: cyclic nucleotide-binding domain-containing protein [Acidobacteriota bacterium]|nr:MAG: cyclic nucleotide-binding domain-containing protein [Acidobacteriota bacterium]